RRSSDLADHDQPDPVVCRSVYGYDTGGFNLHAYFSSRGSVAWDRPHSFWYHYGNQSLYRDLYPPCGLGIVRWRGGSQNHYCKDFPSPVAVFSGHGLRLGCHYLMAGDDAMAAFPVWAVIVG